jgi:predicted CXXCH cytochrome family protein
MRAAIRHILLITAGLAILALSGCDPLSRHKTLATIFDGVPSLPPPEQLCAEYADRKINELRDELTGRKAAEQQKPAGDKSRHNPYEAKKCDNCHDKTTESGFIKPKNELCQVCHTDFIKGSYVHGPVAAGDCLFCHEPHTSRYPSLLKKDVDETCGGCHREKRQAAAMHRKMKDSKIDCTECHNPHFGTVPYFLK